MPQLQYAASQGMIDTRPVQYNVKPNLSGARAIENLQKALQGASQFGAQIGQDNFQEEARNLELKVAQNKEAWAGMSYAERKNSMATLQSELVDKYGEDTYYGRQLRNAGSKAFAAFGAQLQAQGVEEEYLDNLTSQNRGMLQFATDWNAAQNQEERNNLLNKFNENFVAPYENFDDKWSRQLYNNGLKSFAQYQEAFGKTGIAIADEAALSSVLDSAATAVSMYGTVDADLYGEMVGKLSQISNFEENKSKYLTNLGNQIIMGIVNSANEAPRTWENAINFENKLAAFAKVDPRVTNSDAYKSAMTAVRGFKSTANTQDIASLQALVQNDRAKPEEVSMLSSALVARGAITQEVADNMDFLKSERMINKNVTAEASEYYVGGDIESLHDLVSRGKGATVKKVITDNLNLEFATMAEEKDPVEAMTAIMTKVAEYKAMGFDVGSIDAIDAVLSAPSNGGLQTDQDAQNFVVAMKTAIDNGYQSSAITDRAIGDYVVLKAWTKLGVQDMAGKYQSWKTSGARVADADVMEALDAIIDQDWTFAEGVEKNNYQQFKSALAAPIRAALKAGVALDDIKDEWDDAIYANYFEADPFWGGGGRILVPKVGRINDKDAYNTIAEHFGSDSTVLPVDILSPKGKWMVLPADGSEPQLYDFEYMEFLAKTRIAPTPEQLEKYKAGGYN
jgi:hypothetical protein